MATSTGKSGKNAGYGAIDKTRMPGETLPWVLSDPKGILESEVVWLVEVK